MKNLAYIPTKLDKHKLYKEMQQQITKTYNPSIQNTQPTQQPQTQNKKLTKQQLNILLARLTRDTKKQYDIQQQTTNILSANIILKSRRQQSQKVQVRLIQQGKKIQQKKIQLAKQLQQQIKQKYFRQIPEITNKAKNIWQKPIDKRLNQIISDRLNKRQQLKQKYQPKFKPEIDAHSQFINDIQNCGDLQNRMSEKEKQAQKRKSTLILAVQNKTKNQCTFKPIINQKSKDIAQNMSRRPIYSAAAIIKKENQSLEEQQQIYPFAPQINKKSQELIKNKEQYTDTNCFERLYKNAKQISIKHQKYIQQNNKAYSYRPSLNSRSLKIVSSVPKKSGSRLSINDSSDQQYQEIRIGKEPLFNFSRIKTYSMRNSRQNIQQSIDIEKKSPEIFYKRGKLKISNIR